MAYGQQLERSSLKLGVANKAHLYYLPLTVAERRGHFKDYGLTVAIGDFEGGGQSLEALLAGSIDVVTGAYEHTLHTQAKGQDIRAVIEIGRFPGSCSRSEWTSRRLAILRRLYGVSSEADCS